jgi:hypothetical protein
MDSITKLQQHQFGFGSFAAFLLDLPSDDDEEVMGLVCTLTKTIK